jgi:hypothetical protein
MELWISAGGAVGTLGLALGRRVRWARRWVVGSAGGEEESQRRVNGADHLVAPL